MAIIGRRRKYTGETPQISHQELVDRAFTHLRMTVGCTVVFKERKASTAEEPDAIGFKHGFSFLIECKSTRADFLSDKKKKFRARPSEGMGYKRYFMAPVGLLEPAEIPEGWGLLEVYEKPSMQRNRTVKVATESKSFYERNSDAEVAYLVAAIRRLNISMAVYVEREQPESEVGK